MESALVLKRTFYSNGRKEHVYVGAESLLLLLLGLRGLLRWPGPGWLLKRLLLLGGWRRGDILMWVTSEKVRCIHLLSADD